MIENRSTTAMRDLTLKCAFPQPFSEWRVGRIWKAQGHSFDPGRLTYQGKHPSESRWGTELFRGSILSIEPGGYVELLFTLTTPLREVEGADGGEVDKAYVLDPRHRYILIDHNLVIRDKLVPSMYFAGFVYEPARGFVASVQHKPADIKEFDVSLTLIPNHGRDASSEVVDEILTPVQARRRYLQDAKAGLEEMQIALGVHLIRSSVPEVRTEGLYWITCAATKGLAAAQRILGVIYSDGVLAAVDDKLSIDWYGKAADQGDADAQNRLGCIYLEGRRTGKDLNLAFELFSKAAEQGNPEALFNIGLCYRSGFGTDANPVKALEFWEKAARSGIVPAVRDIGVLYANGEGVVKNLDKAIAHWSEAASKGDVLSEAYLGKAYFFKGDLELAFKWHMKAAERNNAYSQNAVGVAYATGKGTDRDYDEAVKWFTKAAEAGAVEAYRNLAFAYSNGYGVARNQATAIEYYRRAVEMGDTRAMVELAKVHLDSDGGLHDLPEAARWLGKAVERGDLEAHFMLGLAYQSGRGVPRDEVTAFEHWIAAADKGYIGSYFNVGLCYANGVGTKSDVKRAFYWFAMAHRFGVDTSREKARRALDVLSKRIDEAARSAIEAEVAQKENISDMLPEKL